MTCFAPASRAIWMISFEVVPRTIESGGGRTSQSPARKDLGNWDVPSTRRTTLPENSKAMALSLRRTFLRLRES